MSQPSIQTLVLLDIDGCVYPGGNLGFVIPVAEEVVTKLKSFSRKDDYTQTTAACVSVEGKSWNLLDLPKAASQLHPWNIIKNTIKRIQEDNDVRYWGGQFHEKAMEILFGCKSDEDLQNALLELANNPNILIGFPTNGPGGHARNVCRSTFTEEVLKTILGEEWRDRVIPTNTLGSSKPNPEAFIEAKDKILATLGLSQADSQLHIVVVDDNPHNLEGAEAAFSKRLGVVTLTCLKIGQESDEFETFQNLTSAIQYINTSLMCNA
jgi:FMN phosphatase YigB (HAD superfamily)